MADGCLTMYHRLSTRSLCPYDLNRHVPGLAVSRYVHTRLPKPEIAEQYRLEKGRQVRIPKTDLILHGVELQSERRLQHEERRAACPGLRRTGDGVKRGASTLPALKTAEQLGKPAQIHIGRGFEQASEHLVNGALVSVSRKPQGDQGVVVRPNRTIVIGHRIVSLLGA